MTPERCKKIAYAIIEAASDNILHVDQFNEMVRAKLVGDYASDNDLLFVLGWLAGLAMAQRYEQEPKP